MSAQYYEQNRGDLPPEAQNSQQQHYGYEQNRGTLPPEADATSANPQYGPGTDVMGAPVNPLSEPTHATATSDAAVDPASTGTRAPPSYDYATQANPADASQASAGNFPTTHLPKSAGTGAASTYEYATPANAPNTYEAPAGNFPTSQMPQNLAQSGAASQQQPGVSPYVQTPAVPGATGKTPMDSIMGIVNKFSKRAEDMTGNVWGHLRTGPNVADTAMGRIALGTRAISEGGLENVYRQTFEVGPDEHLLKTYACYLSTSTGPVAGTLYISTQKLAFCSDRPLAIPTSPGAGNMDTTNEASATSATTPTRKSSSKASAAAAQQQQQQLQHCYYKVMVPISQVESVNPSENTKKKPVEKYIQVKTSDGHEFWFMGFVNYDKGLKNLQETLLTRNANPTTATQTSYNSNTPSTNTTSPTTTTPGSYNTNTNPTYNPTYNTNTSGSYNTNTDPTYDTNTPSSYNRDTDPTYNTNTPSSYNRDIPSSYNTNTDPTYNTDTPSSFNTNAHPTYSNTPSSFNANNAPPTSYNNTNTTSTNTTAPPSYNNTSTASPVV